MAKALDTDAILRDLNGHDGRERARQADNRREMSTDEDYYDSIQWAADDKAELEERGQPANTYNECKPMVQWILGTEKRSRSDWKIVPRSEDDVKPAAAKTKLFKYVSDINKAEYQRSAAFADAVKAGIGWLRVAAEYNQEGGVDLVYRHVPWREMWFDSRSRQADYSDGRYQIRSRYIDLEDAIAFWPNKEAALRAEAQSDRSISTPDLTDDPLEDEFQDVTNTGGEERRLILIKEAWYRKTERVQVLVAPGHELHGQAFDKANVQHAIAIESGSVDRTWVTKRCIYVCLWCNETLLHHQKSPYRHDRFPYVPVWGERFGRNGMPYGAIRQARDPQDSLNKRLSRALYLMCTRGVLMEKGAVEDLRALEEELARSDFIIEYEANKKFQIQESAQFSTAHMAYAERDSAFIRQNSGVTGENLGMETNATSGIAMQARAEQGTIVTTTLFDNLRLAMQVSGEILLSLIEQFITQQMEFRITGERGRDKFITINDGQDDNDITRNQADFIVSEQDYRVSVRQAMSAQAMQLAGAAGLPPQIAVYLAMTAFDLSDLPNKAEIVKQMRELAGLPNPDATDEEKAQQEQAQAASAQAQQRQVEAEIRLKEAAAVQKEAQGQRDIAVAQGEKIQTLMAAFQTAGLITARGDLSPVADEVLKQLSTLTAEAPQGQPGAMPPQQESLPLPDQSAPPDIADLNNPQPDAGVLPNGRPD